jgi:hypothetical protein
MAGILGQQIMLLALPLVLSGHVALIPTMFIMFLDYDHVYIFAI